MTEHLTDVDRLPATELGGLLADMRRKYLHAREEDARREKWPDWLKGEPITTSILERWIPAVERLQQDLARTESAHAVVMGENKHYKQRVVELERELEWAYGAVINGALRRLKVTELPAETTGDGST